VESRLQKDSGGTLKGLCEKGFSEVSTGVKILLKKTVGAM